jgi:hypothetical protein
MKKAELEKLYEEKQGMQVLYNDELIEVKNQMNEYQRTHIETITVSKMNEIQNKINEIGQMKSEVEARCRDLQTALYEQGSKPRPSSHFQCNSIT